MSGKEDTTRALEHEAFQDVFEQRHLVEMTSM